MSSGCLLEVCVDFLNKYGLGLRGGKMVVSIDALARLLVYNVYFGALPEHSRHRESSATEYVIRKLQVVSGFAWHLSPPQALLRATTWLQSSNAPLCTLGEREGERQARRCTCSENKARSTCGMIYGIVAIVTQVALIRLLFFCSGDYVCMYFCRDPTSYSRALANLGKSRSVCFFSKSPLPM